MWLHFSMILTLCVCVYIYVYLEISIYKQTYLPILYDQVYIYMWLWHCIHKYLGMCVYIYIYTHARTHPHTHIHTYIYTIIYVEVCIYIYIYNYIYTSAFLHRYQQWCKIIMNLKLIYLIISNQQCMALAVWVLKRSSVWVLKKIRKAREVIDLVWVCWHFPPYILIRLKSIHEFHW